MLRIVNITLAQYVKPSGGYAAQLPKPFATRYIADERWREQYSNLFVETEDQDFDVNGWVESQRLMAATGQPLADAVQRDGLANMSAAQNEKLLDAQRQDTTTIDRHFELVGWSTEREDYTEAVRPTRLPMQREGDWKQLFRH